MPKVERELQTHQVISEIYKQSRQLISYKNIGRQFMAPEAHIHMEAWAFADGKNEHLIIRALEETTEVSAVKIGCGGSQKWD